MRLVKYEIRAQNGTDMSPRYASVAESTIAHSLVHQDPLSADRTILANERTLLSYIRTALTLIAAGFTFISFFPSAAVQFFGWFILIPAAAILYIGARRYYFLKRSIVGHFPLV